VYVEYVAADGVIDLALAPLISDAGLICVCLTNLQEQCVCVASSEACMSVCGKFVSAMCVFLAGWCVQCVYGEVVRRIG